MSTSLRYSRNGKHNATYLSRGEYVPGSAAAGIKPGQRTWDIAVLNRENVALNRVIIGDSHSRGVGASVMFDRMASRLEKMMQRIYNRQGLRAVTTASLWTATHGPRA